MPDIQALRFALPPVEEQRSIVEYLRRIADSFDELTAEATRAVDLLKERRSALISAAVTGKIDVRGGDDLAASLAEATADIAAGRFVVESPEAHPARIRAMISRDG